MKISNFLRQCKCGHSILFTDTEQMQKCTNCNTTLSLPTSVKMYLLTQKQIIKAKYASIPSLN